jgi:solute carrier family 25 S-adenosylmethionine transporter 26
MDKNKSRDLYETSFTYRMIPNIIAGGVAAMITDLTFFPLETIKTRLQTSDKFLKMSIFKNVYRGISAQVAISFPAGSIYFVGYEGTKFLFDSQLIPNSMTLYQKSFLGGIGAETLRVLLINPFEIVKQQIQVGQQSNLGKSFFYIFKNQGFLGLYRGFWSLLFREIPFSCIQMPIYEVSI